MPIPISRGQSMTILMEYFQGDETTPPIDLTTALFSVDDANFAADPTEILFQAVDLANGRINLVITNEGSESMRSETINWLKVKTKIGSWEDVSPRIEFEVEP